jgi:hypothetical protein
MRRRTFIEGIGALAAVWPLTVPQSLRPAPIEVIE